MHVRWDRPGRELGITMKMRALNLIVMGMSALVVAIFMFLPLALATN